MTDSTVIALTRFRADLSRALTRRAKNLLEASDLPQQVANLEPLEAYFIIKELGVDGALPILKHATTSQVQACIDLDCWDGDTPALEDLDAWLAPFAAEGPDALARMFTSLETELQVLFLAGSLSVYDARSEEIPPESPAAPRMTTPDGFFILERAPKIEREVEPFALVAALYRHNLEEAFRLFTAVHWELPSDLEETAYQFRSGRLQDLGFPDDHEAGLLFSAPPKTAARKRPRPVDGPVTRLPALYAAPLTDTSLLQRALNGITDQESLTALQQELVWVINAAVIAYQNSPRDLAHVSEIAERVRDTLSLGLEILLRRAAENEAARGTTDSGTADSGATHSDTADSDGSSAATVDLEPEAAAATLLQALPLRDIFRHGQSASFELAQLARRQIAEEEGLAAWLARSPSERGDDLRERTDYAFVEALLAPRPLHGAVDPNAPTRCKAFGSVEEIELARAKLTDIVLRRR